MPQYLLMAEKSSQLLKPAVQDPIRKREDFTVSLRKKKK
jgi:hypothetical protein